MCDHYGQSEEWTFALDNINLFFIVVFTSEMLLKMFALGSYYFKVTMLRIHSVCFIRVTMEILISFHFVHPHSHVDKWTQFINVRETTYNYNMSHINHTKCM